MSPFVNLSFPCNTVTRGNDIFARSQVPELEIKCSEESRISRKMSVKICPELPVIQQHIQGGFYVLPHCNNEYYFYDTTTL